MSANFFRDMPFLSAIEQAFAEILRRSGHKTWQGFRKALRVRVGPDLKAARKKAGITVEALSKRTKISVSKLVALEKDDFKDLPKGLYLFSAVRAYGREVRIDPEPLVERLRSDFADKDTLDALQALDAAGALGTKRSGSGSTSQAPNLFRATIAVGVVFLAAGVGTAAYLHNRDSETPLVSLSRSVPASMVPARADGPPSIGDAVAAPEPTKVERIKPQPAPVAAARRKTVARDPIQHMEWPNAAAVEEPADPPANIEEFRTDPPAP